MLPVSPAPHRPSPVPRRRPPRYRRWLVVGVLALLVVPLLSLGQALAYPGNAGVAVRTVEWVRDHGGAGLVNWVENWWYRDGPTASAPPPGSLPAPGSPATAGATRRPDVPAPLTTRPGLVALPGEGTWTAGTPGRDGAPAIYTTFIRPDPAHPSVVAGVARFDQARTRVELLPGTREPVANARTTSAQVPPDQRSALVATFNSGFKMKDARGGYLRQGRTLLPLRDGAATLVVRADGTATVGQWGRDVGSGPDVVAARQNLALIVENGKPVAGLATNADGSWGSARNQFQYTWRSAVGVDARSNLLYVAGPDLTLATVTEALTQAGAVTGMELDIHPPMVHMFTYRHTGSGLSATKLLPSMVGPDNRYLVPDQRDFVAVTLR